MLRDTFNRPVRDLRISVTDRCNFRCTYCMPLDEYEWPEKGEILSFEEIARLAALNDTCTHRGGPLSEGEIEGEQVTCPWHGAIYNIKNGEVLSPPAPRGVACYNVRVAGTDIEVEV